MYYEVNGKPATLRGLFSSMPPLTHHRDDAMSEVLLHIAATLQCSPQSARRAFDSMRQPKVAVLLFDAPNAVWHGCDWVPENETDSNRMMTRRVTRNAKKVEQFASGHRKLEAALKRAVERLDEIDNALVELFERVAALEGAVANPSVAAKAKSPEPKEDSGQDLLDALRDDGDDAGGTADPA